MSAKLEQNKDVAYLSYKLATIKTDVELDVTCDELTVSPPDDKQLHQLFSRYEFKRWLADVEAGKWLDSKRSANRANKQSIFCCRRYGPTAEVTAVLSQENYQTILDEKALADWIERLKAAEVFAFDTETDGLDTLSCNLIGMSLLSLQVKRLICLWLMITWMPRPT